MLDSLSDALADRYRVVREIGEGGMATVHLAYDLKHDRQVAIKVLKPELGAVLGVERFLAEIKVTANLQHPNLLPLFDSGEAGGLLFYVMPFVEGETLRARLEREQQLPVEEALRLSVAIAQALDYAHRRGVIHRDLKPENILLPDGQPMVADFGIALAVSKAGGQRVTQTGLSLGTPQYMSPEQATGDRTVDARTDIYSLGAMTYEMLTGEPPHSGATAQAIIAKLMTEEVRPLTVLRRSVPSHVDATVRNALEKLAADRFASANDFAQALLGKGDAAMLARYSSNVGSATSLGTDRSRRWRERGAWALTAVATAALVWFVTRPDRADEAPVIRMTIDTPVGENPMVGGYPITVSPQGDRLAYVLQGATGYRTVARRVSEIGQEVTLARESLRSLTFSPDGRWLAYANGNEIRRIPSDGGQSERLGSTGNRVIVGLAWTAKDMILIGTESALLELPARGGTPRVVTDSSSQQRFLNPMLLPNGKTVLVRTTDIAQGGAMVAVSLETGVVTPLEVNAERALGLVDGHLIHVTPTFNIAAVPFDPKTLRSTGDVITIATGVDGAGLSATGTLAFMPDTRQVRMVFAGEGSEVPVRDEIGNYRNPRLSPDGERIAVSLVGTEGIDIWIYDRTARTFRRLTTEGINTAPEWSPDGHRVIYKAVRDRGLSSSSVGGTTIMWVPADGSGRSELLFESDVLLNEAIMSPDGRWLIVRTAPGGAWPRDILAVDLSSDRTLRPLAAGPFSEQMPRLSPDGRWLAYMADESGRMEIYVRPFPDEGARVQVSTDGGAEPLWDRSGRTLYFRSPRGITATAVTTGAAFTLGERRLVLPGNDPPDATHPSYDVMPDGRRFLVLRTTNGEDKAIVVFNWAREFRGRLARGAP